ncbi:MAG: GNAT family N-acetyltransferase [Alphaproteobacteria bacterium]|nr:GNAT family N-acetyltransferase [Alphaproteobacteria bacterium]
MAFHIKRRWGLTYIKMPHLTRTMSPRFFSLSSKPAVQRIERQGIVVELMRKLPRHDRFERSLEPDCPSTQGFVHANLAVAHMYTFRSAPGEGADVMLQRAHPETRRIMGKAQRECEVERSLDLDRFVRLHKQTYGESSLVDYDVLQRLFEAATARGRTEILFVRLNGEADTAAMILLSDSSTYAWLVARNSAQNYRGASSLLVLEAMRSAEKAGRILDLDGYVRPAVGAFMMKFGLPPIVRPYVNGSSRRWQFLRAATTLWHPNRTDRHFRVP